MTLKAVSWNRLVRHFSASGSADVRYGDPILPDSSTGSDIVRLPEQGRQRVKVGEDYNHLSFTPTGRTEAMKALPGPR